jgi:hypothetical protein
MVRPDLPILGSAVPDLEFLFEPNPGLRLNEERHKYQLVRLSPQRKLHGARMICLVGQNFPLLRAPLATFYKSFHRPSFFLNYEYYIEDKQSFYCVRNSHGSFLLRNKQSFLLRNK